MMDRLPPGKGRWKIIRIGHVTGKALPDLVVVVGWHSALAYVRVYTGSPKPPYFRSVIPITRREWL